ncbi:hypothetical protein [Tolumonas auensis]|uniref:hypothetical protein n=1 Tax=Tolumonas auensis TaxID=43948 RepID=UPI002AA7FD80|nr:hypothetical protein [Tolumonas auensis]
MFSDSVADFIANSMKIELDSIESKLNEPDIQPHQAQIIDAIEYFVTEIQGYEPHRQKILLPFGISNKTEDAIDHYAVTLLNNFDPEDTVYQVIDSIRHAFSSYAFNGLHQLYTRQENESWYPKIVLTEVLEPNDISNLEQEITVYRGCDIGEYNTSTYGQAWTTSLDIARQFAYGHYANQLWYDESKRVVLKCNYNRSEVLFSHQSVEFEVVVNAEKLTDVEIYT